MLQGEPIIIDLTIWFVVALIVAVGFGAVCIRNKPADDPFDKERYADESFWEDHNNRYEHKGE